MNTKENFVTEVLAANKNSEETGTQTGYPIGTPTVKELIAILSKLPEDYRVTCCGAKSYLYLNPRDKYITIDSEQYLA